MAHVSGAAESGLDRPDIPSRKFLGYGVRLLRTGIRLCIRSTIYALRTPFPVCELASGIWLR